MVAQSPQYAVVLNALTSAGPAGIGLNALKATVWPESAPQNWRVILAMRVTKARKTGLTIECRAGRYRIIQPMEVENG